ncbi:hypothetical protein [Sulfolobus sp. E11-6]|uniref:hypothetical protein n=1 Tax=Sulfolobus sp. E11-6 TaxID=2663020 RepID=UPI00129808A6|nr:hypothetical protein [Sulfolobus sp. E11-6]QGA69026.1 hypothetical protein GFS33_10175 [Sulfolobus sp. E11-6]
MVKPSKLFDVFSGINDNKLSPYLGTYSFGIGYCINTWKIIIFIFKAKDRDYKTFRFSATRESTTLTTMFINS